jgi:hypothetical protein
MRVLTLFLLGVLVLVALEPTPCTSIAPVVYAGAAAAARFGGPAVRAVVPKIKQVFHQYSTRKAAKEAAQRASRGSVPTLTAIYSVFRHKAYQINVKLYVFMCDMTCLT